jgi:hypothetical protein
LKKIKTTEEKLLYGKSTECTKIWGPFEKIVVVISLWKDISMLQTSFRKARKEKKIIQMVLACGTVARLAIRMIKTRGR